MSGSHIMKKVVKMITATTNKKGRMKMEEKKGRYGAYGGQYIPETLIPAVQELEQAYEKYKNEPGFQAELKELMDKYAGRPSLLYYAEKMTKDLGGAKIYLKRGRPEPHRIPQDQQCIRTGASGKEDGQDACHRGDRSRAARCGDCHGSGIDGDGM